MKQILLAFAAGTLITGAVLGSFAFVQLNTLQSENAALHEKLKKQSSRHKRLSQTQADLQAELDSIKSKKDQDYEQTIGALMQAKENAGIESLYEIGVNALQNKDYPVAYYALSDVQESNAQFKEIAKFYPQAQKAYTTYQQKELDDKLAATYAQALDYQIKGQFAQAKEQYQRVLELKSNYKDATTRLKRVSLYLKTQQQNTDFQQKHKWLEATYQLGLKQQSLGRWQQAKEAYESIANNAPNYKDIGKRLKLVKARLPKTQLANTNTSSLAASCYQKGQLFGKCAGLSPDKTACAQVDLKHPPLECKDNPEFINGMKSAVNVSTESNPDVSAADFFKGLPGLLDKL